MADKIFIGPNKVKDVQTLTTVHRGTMEMVKVLFENGSDETMTLKSFGALKSDHEQDLSSLRTQLYDAVVRDTLELLVSYNVKVDDIQFFIASLTTSINNSLGVASAKLWRKEKHLVDLLDVETVLSDKLKLDDILGKKDTDK